MTKPITLSQLFNFYRSLPHQTAAVAELEKDLAANGYQVAMDRERPWFNTWSSAPSAKEPLLRQEGALLQVPYFSQMDNEQDSDGPGWRQCASSSCAMVAAYWGKVASDEAYKDIRQRFGDTTDPMAHVAALQNLGLVVSFRTNGTAALLRSELDASRPVAVGWLHHGPISAPSGGGHWTILIGYNAYEWIHHDPYGEANMLGGGYITTAVGSGRSVRYSISNWLKRWAPNANDGWMITAHP